MIRFKTGSILAVLTAVAAILGILSLSYLSLFSSEFNLEKKRYYHALAQKFLQTVHRDAFLSLKESILASDSSIKSFFYQPEAGKEKLVLVPFGREIIGSELPTGCTCEVTCKLEIKSFSNIDDKQLEYRVSGVGHGILAIASSLSIFKENGPEKILLATEQIETHHDFLVASILDKGFSKPLFSQPLTLSNFRRQSYELFTNILEYPGFEQQKSDVFQNEMPFDKVTLWSAKRLQQKQLKKMGIIDFEKRQICLNGIVHCSEKLSFDGPWQISGKGVLIADEIKIAGAMGRVSDNDLVILFARRGKIHISTDHPIEVALIAMNRNGNGTILVEKKLQVHGAIIADQVILPRLEKGVHTINWNSSLNDLEKSLSVSLGSWQVFRSDKVEKF